MLKPYKANAYKDGWDRSYGNGPHCARSHASDVPAPGPWQCLFAHVTEEYGIMAGTNRGESGSNKERIAVGAWVLKDATSSWETVFDRAWAGEPQFVSRDGAQTVVVISLRSYQAAKPKKRRTIIKNPKLAFSISDADLFSDDSAIWEACNGKGPLA